MSKAKATTSQIKDALFKALKEANECVLHFPEERSALKYANAIQNLINVCEKRGRY